MKTISSTWAPVRPSEELMSHLQTFILSSLCALSLAVLPAQAATASLTVAWDGNTVDLDLAGYRVYQSTDSTVFSLTPSQAQALATTRDVTRLTTSTMISGLDPTQVYWFAVTALDTSANESGFSNVVSAQPRDTLSPVVSLTAPLSGAAVSGFVNMTANASDDVGVTGVQFLVDGIDTGAEDTLAPFSAQWNSTGASGGSHMISARARDGAGNTTTSVLVQVTTSTTSTDTTSPTVGMSTPAGGSTVQGSVTISAAASDNVGVWSVQFLLGGVPLGAEDTTAPYAISWDTNTLPNGLYSISARARDAAGNIATTDGRNLTIGNTTTPPCPDVDADGVCDATDNCPAIYNPGQQNTDGVAEGGGAGDITIIFPLSGDVTCADPPPTF